MIKDEKVVVLTDRVRKLTEELNEKKAHFQQISKDCFSVHKDYQTKSTYLKELKSKAAKKTKRLRKNSNRYSPSRFGFYIQGMYSTKENRIGGGFTRR